MLLWFFGPPNTASRRRKPQLGDAAACWDTISRGSRRVRGTQTQFVRGICIEKRNYGPWL